MSNCHLTISNFKSFCYFSNEKIYLSNNILCFIGQMRMSKVSIRFFKIKFLH